ncbi:CDP-diacylglycerol--glycerol-3-phosphate 3-phosphatidyltransferase [Aquisphaera insulae]|uniref:CDP-diacylglycerol--glycerol-3-phosphate 3-phosphatidyltransferase n=1 Tax=Aquisphaera insulae TaxID=2712864 RepID=UPI0013EC1A22|nr:CDP-diacylglycerol--glycerol-3-phosphate 3-phosphatidyltransferase [Aquisphaera insulae]
MSSNREDADATATVPYPPARRPRFWNVPNSLSVGRLVLSMVVFALMGSELYAAALVVFILAAFSDWLDGYFARLLHQDTPIGRQLDPLIDKVIVSGCYIYLAAMTDRTGVYPWMVTAIVVRELLIQGLRSLLEGQGQPFGAKMAGKLKTTAQCFSIGAALLALALSNPPDWLLRTRDVITWLAVGLTIYSGASYLSGAMPALRGQAVRKSP